MHFCVNCQNMYYIKLGGEEGNEGNELLYYCRNCGHENTEIGKQDIYVSKTMLKAVDNNYLNIINKYTKYDPTLPRITNVSCPNSTCPSKGAASETPAEVIMMRYDDKNLKYVYLCPECDTTWKN